MSELSRQIEAYQRLRPQILEARRTGWVLIVHEELVDVFPDFEKAALYADAHYPSEQVLIRSTSEEKGIVPFIISNR